MKHRFWMLALLFAIELCVIMLLVPGQWTEQVIESEANLTKRSLGQSSVVWIHDKASLWYTHLVENTDILGAMHRFLIPSEEQRLASTGIEDMGSGFFVWWDNRIEALGYLIYQVLVRFALLLMWLPYIAALAIPAVFDGWMTWKIKRTNFDYASPIVHRYSTRGITTAIFGLLVVFFLPIAIDPIIVPVVLMLIAVLLGLSAGNLQKRI